MQTTEDATDPICELISTEQPLGLCDLAFAMNPLRFDCIEPRALGRQKARHYPHPGFATTVFDPAVVGADPASHLMAFVPGGIVPDQKQGLLAPLLEPVAAPLKKLRGYGTNRATIHEPQPGLFKLRQIKPVAGECFGLGIALSSFLLDEADRLCGIRPGMQRRSLEARKPGLVLETQSPLRMALGQPDQPISIPFFLSYSGSGLSTQRLARSQRTPNRDKVARMVSPLTLLSVMPSSKLTSAAIESVQKVFSLPNFLGSWWSNCRRVSTPLSSKAAWTSLGRDEPASRASRPRALKAWMALRTVWEPHPRFSAIRGGCSPLELAKRIWQRLRTKASEERSPASSRLRSSFESVRTKIGGFMSITVTHHPLPVLQMH